jgi:hypothetical protein
VSPTESRPPLADDARPDLSPTDWRSPLTNSRRTRPARPHRVPALTPARTDNPARTDQPRLPRLGIDRSAVRERYAEVLIAHGHKDFVSALVRSVIDVPALVSEVERLWLALVASRRRTANLAAACRAAIAAEHDGEADPLSYVRDQLAELAETVPPQSESPVDGGWAGR